MVRWVESGLGGREWNALVDERAPPGPTALQQSFAYGQAVGQHGAQVARLVWEDDQGPAACVQIVRRKVIPMLSAVAVFRGPVWLRSLSAPEQANALRALKRRYSKWRGRFLFVMPEAADDADARQVMRLAGMRRVMTGYSTIWLDLSRGTEKMRESLVQKWRASLNVAERAGLDIAIGGRKAHQYRWLLEQEEEQRQRVRYLGLPTGLVEDFANAAGDDQNVLALTAIRDREKLAGMLFLLHGTSATYFVGWNGDQGRNVSAHNLLLWRAVEDLRGRGVRWLDLGGINTGDGAGIARFKLGLGGSPITLAGTWL